MTKKKYHNSVKGWVHGGYDKRTAILSKILRNFSTRDKLLLVFASTMFLWFSIKNRIFFVYEIESSIDRWLIFVSELFLLALLALFAITSPETHEKWKRFFRKNQWIKTTLTLMILTLILGSLFIALLSKPFFDSDIYTIEEHNMTIKYQLSSYKQSQFPIPGDRMCINAFVTNNNRYSVNISANAKLIFPDKTNFTEIKVDLGSFEPENKRIIWRKVCVDIIKPGLNTWNLDLFFHGKFIHKNFPRQELSPLVYTPDQLFERGAWSFGLMNALLLVITFIPRLMKDLKYLSK